MHAEIAAWMVALFAGVVCGMALNERGWLKVVGVAGYAVLAAFSAYLLATT